MHDARCKTQDVRNDEKENDKVSMQAQCGAIKTRRDENTQYAPVHPQARVHVAQGS